MEFGTEKKLRFSTQKAKNYHYNIKDIFNSDEGLNNNVTYLIGTCFKDHLVWVPNSSADPNIGITKLIGNYAWINLKKFMSLMIRSAHIDYGSIKHYTL